jgi:hypothetical protein
MSDPGIIIIHVGKGEEKKLFQMIKSKLRSKSSVFENKFKADETLRTILLPEDNPGAFGLQAQWLFTGSIEQFPLRNGNASVSASSSTSAATSQTTPLTTLERKECIKIAQSLSRARNDK